MSDLKQKELLGLDIQELTAIIGEFGQASYRARQLFTAIYNHRIGDLAAISTLPKQLRLELAERFKIELPQVEKKFVSVDGTIRYLFLLSDGESVETVWMPEGDGGESGDGSDAGEEEQRPGFDRATICVSSQVGCAVGCQFCMTALLGVKRSLTAGEIVGQIVAVLNDHQVSTESERINLVFMGMGEPFLNYANLVKAVHLLIDGVGIAESRMTISTAGIVPRIYDFGKEPRRPKLAISLNASNDEQRDRLMPINRKWNLDALLTAAREFPLRKRERLTFEYVLLRETNDSPENAYELGRLLQGIRCKVNLIALNPGPEIPFGMPGQEAVQRFQQILIDGGIPAFVRRPRGRDIYAACGQLKRTTELGVNSPQMVISAPF